MSMHNVYHMSIHMSAHTPIQMSIRICLYTPVYPHVYRDAVWQVAPIFHDNMAALVHNMFAMVSSPIMRVCRHVYRPCR